MIRLRKLMQDHRGSVAVEFALMAPVFLSILFGVIELGSGWYNKQMLVNASREGARLGISAQVEGVTAADVEAHVTNVLNQAGFPGTFTVNVSGVGGGPGSEVRVEITSDYNLPVLGSLLPEGISTVGINAVTVMRHE